MKIKNYIYTEKEFVEFSELNEKEKEEISMRLNETALRQAGYEKKGKVENMQK